jgi:hypothetical protein
MNQCSKRNYFQDCAQGTYAYYRQHGLSGIIRNCWTWLLADSDRLTALSTFAIFLATAVAVGVGIAQWRVLSGQLSEMKSSSEQIERSITASNRIADESKKANALTGEANRPWMGAAGIIVAPSIYEGKPFTVTMAANNAGKTPALVTSIKCGSGILEASPTNPTYTLTAAQIAVAS